VLDVLSDAIPATLLLTIVALCLNLMLGCLLGLYAGLKHNRKSGTVFNWMALLLYAIPPFWLAIFLVYLFSTKLGWLPPSGMSSLTFTALAPLETFADRLRHLILPASVLGLVGAAATFRFVRANVMHILQQDYIRFATAKGLSFKRILFKHVLKNALIPVVTLLGLYLPLLLGGAFIIEVIFAWPGMGRITYSAILSKDFPLLMAINLSVALFVIAGNALADALYNIVDPRVRLD
jgi:peptide/nickel transport system permease protein